MRLFIAGLLAAGAVIASSVPAAAIVSTGCSTYASSNSNGATTFPGTYVGTAGVGSGQVCQIGDLATYNGGSGGAFVNTAHNPSIYEFYWGGGTLTITERIGNNGIGDAINVGLYNLASQDSTAPDKLLDQITIPFSSGPSATYTVETGNLPAGYFAIDTSLAVNNVADPNYQINFAVPTPEPGTLTLVAGGLLAAGLRRRARRR